MPSKTVMVISDLHCGHLVGLCPPSRHATLAKSASQSQKKLEKIRQELWRIFALEVKKVGPVDRLFVLGDTVDGSQRRTNGSELIPGCNDMQDQCDMAAECIKFIKAPQVYMVHGTPYHAGQDEDWERYVCRLVQESKYTEKAIIRDHAFVDINGCMFSLRHKIGGGMPHTRGTQLAKQKMANLLWSEIGMQPKADIFLRGHVHAPFSVGDDEYISISCPGLQGVGSKFGARQCDFPVKWGFTVFNINEEGGYSWRFVTPKEANKLQKVEVITA